MNRLMRIGSVAPWFTIMLYMTQFAIIAVIREPYPAAPEAWFALFNRSAFLGLIYLNALDGFSIAIIGLLFLALWAAFKETNPSRATIAIYFALIGVSVFVATRGIMVTGTLHLSRKYALAATSAEESMLLAAGAALMNVTRATPETFGFLFLALAGVQFSLLILKSNLFRHWLGYLGVGALVATLLNDVSLIFFPAAASALMIVNGLSWFIWWVGAGHSLRRHA